MAIQLSYIDYKRSERDVFLDLLVFNTPRDALISKQIKIGTPEPILKDGETIDYPKKYFLDKPINRKTLFDLGEILSKKVSVTDDIDNTTIKIGGGDYFEETTLSYYRKDLEYQLITTRIMRKFYIYNRCDTEENYIEYICKSMYLPKDSVDFSFDYAFPKDSDKRFLKSITITAKPESLLFVGQVVITPNMPFTYKNKYLELESKEPCVTSRVPHGMNHPGVYYRPLNQGSLSIWDNSDQFLDSNYGALMYVHRRVSSLHFESGSHRQGKITHIANDYRSRGFLETYFPRGLVPHTQYIAIPKDTKLNTLPENFLKKGSMTAFLNAYNQHMGGIYASGATRSLTASELTRSLRYFGNILYFPSTLQYVLDDQFTECNPKILILDNANVSFTSGAATFFTTNQLKLIYHRTRPIILYYTFNVSSGNLGSVSNDVQATQWFTSKGITLKPMKD